MGLFDSILGPLFGSEVPQAAASGAFKGASKLTDPYIALLLERLTTPPEKTSSFLGMEQALRESITGQTAGARQRLSDAAVSGGYFDSGQRLKFLTQIDRAGLQEYTSGLRDILLSLEQRRTSEVLPFLSGAAQESLGVQNANIQGALGERAQDTALLQTGLGFIPQPGSSNNDLLKLLLGG